MHKYIIETIRKNLLYFGKQLLKQLLTRKKAFFGLPMILYPFQVFDFSLYLCKLCINYRESTHELGTLHFLRQFFIMTD